jgi:hypothetical protein
MSRNLVRVKIGNIASVITDDPPGSRSRSWPAALALAQRWEHWRAVAKAQESARLSAAEVDSCTTG